MDRVPEEHGALRRLAPLAGAALFFAALVVLHRELRDVHYAELSAAVARLPPGRVLLALLLTGLNYLVLTGYDQLAVEYAGLRLHRGRVALAGFVSYAISNSLGFGMLSGAAVRFRFYTRWGVGALELSKIVLFQSTTFWLGLLALGGATLGFAPHPWLRDLPAAPLVRALGLALLGLGLAYALLPFARKAPLRLGRFEVPVPTARLAAGQFVLSILDWGLAAAVLQALLPPGAVPFGELLGAFLAAQIVGLVSHVPGGLGVFETLMVLGLKPYLPATSVLTALVLYRAIYYLLPLASPWRCWSRTRCRSAGRRSRGSGERSARSRRRWPRGSSRRSPSWPGRVSSSRGRPRPRRAGSRGCRTSCPCRSSSSRTSSAASWGSGCSSSRAACGAGSTRPTTWRRRGSSSGSWPRC